MKNREYYEWPFLFLISYIAIKNFETSSFFLAFLFASLALLYFFLSQKTKNLLIGFQSIFVLFVYLKLNWLINSSHEVRLDPWIAQLEQFLGFSWLDEWAKSNYNKWAFELLSFSYLLYFPAIFFLVFWHYFIDKKLSFFSGFLFIYWVGFIGYVFLPIQGMVFYQPFTLPPKGYVGEFLTWLVTNFSNGQDGFPSLHTAASLYFLQYSRINGPRFFYFIWIPSCLLLLISLVYLRFHYVLDILAGALLAYIGWKIASYEKEESRTP